MVRSIGIHAHDSQGLALSNTIEAIKNDILGWIVLLLVLERSGNTKTEELIVELDNFLNKNTNLVPLIKIINRQFKPLKDKFMGYKYFYYLAGKYAIHPSCSINVN